MYTIEGENDNQFDEEYSSNSFWDNNKGLIIKIIIIILCIIVLVWLFKALKTKRNTVSDESVHIANVQKVRLAAEEYYFINNKKKDNEVNVVSLSTLKSLGLTDDIVDANNKVCSEKATDVTLAKEIDAYKMTVKLSCSTNDNEETFYYHGNTLACLNCDGKTNMTGNASNHADNNEENGGNNNDSVAVPVSSNSNDEYSCTNWSNWTKTRVNNPKLKERTKTLVLGVKYTYTTKKVYSKWSDYIKEPIKESDDIEIETKTVNEDVWSETKTARHVTPSDRIRIINTRIVYDDDNNCKKGFIENGVCYSNKTKIGNLTLTEYNSGRYMVENKYCEGIKTLKNNEGKYVLTYVNCKYHEALDDKNTENRYYTVYDYQELETKEVVYYRYRVVTTIREQLDPIYTNGKYEEKDLPEGFIKVPGSEEVYYSYKYASCEK